jgi:hypothetical protein
MGSGEQSDMMAQYHQFLKMIEVPLLRAFQAGESGEELAENLINLGDNGYFGPGLQGLQVYRMVTENGKMMISTLIKTYPPIWDVVKLTPNRWDEFLDRFFRAEAIWEDQDKLAADAEDEVVDAVAQPVEAGVGAVKRKKNAG